MGRPARRGATSVFGPLFWGLSLVILLAVGAWWLRVLDARGSFLAGLFGALILLGTGFAWLALLAGFTAAGFIATRLGYERKRLIHVAEPEKGRRGWTNVLSNGVTATAVATAGLFVAPELLILPFAVAVAVAAADTFASELGTLGGTPVLITNPKRKVPPGTNGGITWVGTGASALGAIMVAAAAHLLIGLPDHYIALVVVTGIGGSFIDSLLGATWEGTPGLRDGPLSKADVNFISITLPTLLVFVPSILGVL
jgi:uncharacterized protein (TIGR00297 family)